MFIDEEIEFIKSQIAHHRKSVEFFTNKGEVHKVNRHTGILRRFESILPKIVEVKERGVTPPNDFAHVSSDKVGARFGDLHDLPEELRSQLVSIQHDELEQQILDVINQSYAGVATIDEIMVGLYRSTEEVHKRETLATKIYRMTRKDLLFSVTGKKGVYSTSNADSYADKVEENKNGDT